MRFPITKVPTYAAYVLAHHTYGSVHSIYNKTINLQFGTHLLSLQTANSPLSPVSLITSLDREDMANLKLAAGQSVILEQNCITFPAPETSCSFSFADAYTINLELTPPFPPVQKEIIAEALKHSHAGGFGVLFPHGSPKVFDTAVSGNQEFILPAARLRIKNCTQFMRQGAFKEAALELVRLLGLGIGLTPSGDDFLCGVLAGLTFSGQLCHPFSMVLQSAIREHLSDTNDISRTFLICALQSHFSHAVISLPLAESPDAILAEFEAIGHSSGIDTLCGIYYALSLFQ